MTLTDKQQRYLDYLRDYIREHGRAPSLREAAEAFGVSHAAVGHLLKVLEEKGYIRREGRYSRTVHILNRVGAPPGPDRARTVPIIGRITAGLPMYAQEEWSGTVAVDAGIYRGAHLFALRVQGDSMKNVGILDGDLAICEPRQYAENGDIVVALIDGEEATVKRFFLHSDRIELRPENPDFQPVRYGFGEILIQGKVVGVLRGPDGIRHLNR